MLLFQKFSFGIIYIYEVYISCSLFQTIFICLKFIFPIFIINNVLSLRYLFLFFIIKNVVYYEVYILFFIINNILLFWNLHFSLWILSIFIMENIVMNIIYIYNGEHHYKKYYVFWSSYCLFRILYIFKIIVFQMFSIFRCCSSF